MQAIRKPFPRSPFDREASGVCGTTRVGTSAWFGTCAITWKTVLRWKSICMRVNMGDTSGRA
jgi:hypothetical protein